MSELTLLILRIGFLLLLWLFIFAIVYALRSDLFGAPVRRMRGDANGGGSGSPVVVSAQSPAPSPAAQQGAQATAPVVSSAPPITPSAGALPTAAAGGSTGAAATGFPRTLAITSGVATGTTIALDEDFVTIGRSGDSTLVIVDEYTSTYHARLARSGDHWVLTDLDSTNGTRLNGDRVTKPVTVPMYTPVTIGTTTFELRP